MPTLEDLRAHLDAAIKAIDDTKDALAAQLGNLKPGQRQRIQSEIIALSLKEGKLRGTFLRDALQTKEIQDAIDTMKIATDNMNAESGKIKSATTALASAAKVLNIASQIIGALAPLLAI